MTVLGKVNALRAVCFGDGVDTRSGAVKGEGPRMEVADAINEMVEEIKGAYKKAREESHQAGYEAGRDAGRSATEDRLLAQHHEELTGVEQELSAWRHHAEELGDLLERLARDGIVDAKAIDRALDEFHRLQRES